uniref:Uncharacterized protein n=1 Tax=Hucho hucho TaxID=62062 RepID=A0A4W5LBX0_9TELE
SPCLSFARFVSRVEEVLNDWKLIGNSASKPPEKGEYTSGTWEKKTKDINFADFKFSVTHHYLKQESEESEGKDEPEEGTVLLPLLLSYLSHRNGHYVMRLY